MLYTIILKKLVREKINKLPLLISDETLQVNKLASINLLSTDPAWSAFSFIKRISRKGRKIES